MIQGLIPGLALEEVPRYTWSDLSPETSFTWQILKSVIAPEQSSQAHQGKQALQHIMVSILWQICLFF